MAARLALVATFVAVGVVATSSAAQASEADGFVLPPDVHYYTSCGRYWPSTGYFQTTSAPGTNYVATMDFTLTQPQINALACVSAYLELDFRIFGFQLPGTPVPYSDNCLPGQWDNYTVSTNIPGAIHDIATSDYSCKTSTPGVTDIRVSQLQPGVEYYASVSFNLPLNSSWGSPRVSMEWVPSYWAASPAEATFCAVYQHDTDANCVFGLTRVYLSHGYNNGVSLIFDGFRWWQYTPATPPSSAPPTTDIAPPTQPVQPPPSYPPAQMFIRGDSAVFARNGIGTSWTQETDAGTATAIASSSTGIQMLIAGDASVWAKRGVSYGGWSQEAVGGNAKAIAVGGETQMFLRGDNAVFAMTGTGQSWVQETDPGTAVAIAVSSTGLQMIIVNDGSVWAKYGVSIGGWSQQVGPGNASAIAVGGDTQMFIRGDAAVFARTGLGTSWTQELGPGNASKIAVSATGLQMFIRGDAAVFSRYGIGTSWTQQVGPGNAWAVAVGGDTQLFARGDNALLAGPYNGGWTQETASGNTAAIATG